MTNNSKESLPIHHVGPSIDPYLREQIRRFEGWDMEEIFSPEFREVCHVYMSSPLQATTKRTAFEHILQTLRYSLLIEGATYEKQKVVPFIPHTEILSYFNEFKTSRHREVAVKTNMTALAGCEVLVTIGTRISPGMREEINKANELGIPVMSFSKFKKKLSDLPKTPQSQKEKEEFALRIFELVPKGVISEGIFLRIRGRK